MNQTFRIYFKKGKITKNSQLGMKYFMTLLMAETFHIYIQMYKNTSRTSLKIYHYT